MLTRIIKLWDAHQSKLEEYFKTTNQGEYSNYVDIVKAVFTHIINQEEHDYKGNYDVSKIVVIDDGDYQGTQLFIIHRDTYQPSEEDYLITSVGYGSCSGCDTLQAINSYDDDLPNEGQVKDYMQLSLHLIQNMKSITEEETMKSL